MTFYDTDNFIVNHMFGKRYTVFSYTVKNSCSTSRIQRFALASHFWSAGASKGPGLPDSPMSAGGAANVPEPDGSRSWVG